MVKATRRIVWVFAAAALAASFACVGALPAWADTADEALGDDANLIANDALDPVGSAVTDSADEYGGASAPDDSSNPGDTLEQGIDGDSPEAGFSGDEDSLTVHSAGWAHDADGWRYYAEDGKCLTGLRVIAGADGAERTYFFLDDGLMATGLKSVEGFKYYFAPKKTTSNPLGSALTSQWIRSSKNGKWYYFNQDSHMVVSSWKKVGGKWYHFDSKGRMQTGWLKLGKKTYYLTSSGAMKTGWMELGGHKYYFGKSGVMAVGVVGTQKWKYYFDSYGHYVSRKSQAFQAIAHRGYSLIYPEASLLAFEKACQSGFDAIECDVWVTSSGEVVVMHDYTLRRTCGVGIRSWDLTADERANITILHNAEGNPVQYVPTLTDVAKVARQYNKSLYVHVKQATPYGYPLTNAKINKIVASINAAGMSKRTTILGFRPVLNLFKNKGLSLGLVNIKTDYASNVSDARWCSKNGVGLLVMRKDFVASNHSMKVIAYCYRHSVRTGQADTIAASEVKAAKSKGLDGAFSTAC